MKLAIVALAASAKTMRAAPVSAAGAADRARGGTRSTAGRNLGAGAVRNLARLTVVLSVCGLAYGTTGEALAAGAEQFRYHFVPLAPTVPPGLGAFNPAKITENGAIYGTAITCGPGGPYDCKYTVAVYRNGVTT